MKHIYFFIITVVFLMLPANASAQTTPLGNIPIPFIGQENNDDKNNAGNEDNSSKPQPTKAAPSVIPTLPIERKTETRQPTPAPTNKPLPVPTTPPDTTPKQIIPQFGGTDPIRVPQNRGDRVLTETKDDDNETKNSTISVTPTPAVLGTVSNTKNPPPKVQPKEEVNVAQTPMKQIQDIIAPPLASLMQVKGANYYEDERLAPGMTSSLISIALVLFLAGITILKLPILMKSAKRIRAKLKNREDADSFRIPNLELK